jgi:DNA-binding transcriptional ArsR family regulator
MARLPTTSDVYNAIAEPQRRDIIDLLKKGELPVNDIADALGMKQPQTSKHLKVLKEVGLVGVRKEGKQRLYKLNSQELKPVFDWIQSYEHLWRERYDRLDDYLTKLQQKGDNQ